MLNSFIKMFPDWVYRPSANTASVQIWPKGDYEVIVGTLKAFLNKNDDGTDKNWGIRCVFQLADDDTQKIIYSGYLHTQGASSFVKGFQLACYGVEKKPSAEKMFDEQYDNADWSLNFETGEVGEAWKNMEGSRIIASVDTQINKQTGDEQQQFKNFRPLGS